MRWLKPAVFIACLYPLGQAFWWVFVDGLSAEPIEQMTHHSGEWALIFLLVTLLMTPLYKLTHRLWPIRIRRMLGLFAFFYACLHFLIYLVFDLSLGFDLLWDDLTERPYILVGFAALMLLLPLAVTSTKGWMRRLKKRWKQLHWLIYPAAVLVVLHFYWLVKLDVTEPLIFAAILGVLFLLRVPQVIKPLSRLRLKAR